jgi:hypothetical protein
MEHSKAKLKRICDDASSCFMPFLIGNMSYRCFHCYAKGSQLTTDHFDYWSSALEVTNSTIVRKWEWLFTNSCECRSLISVVTEFYKVMLRWTEYISML